MSRILLVDGLSVLTRAYCANPAMSQHGHHIGGTVGFLNSLKGLVDRFSPQHVVIAWEGGGSARRRSIYSDYKGGRKPLRLNRFYKDDIPDSKQNRNYQVVATVNILKNVPVNQLYVSDCEADDLIGYLSRYSYPDDEIIIVSSDRDFYQLLSDRVTQWTPGKKVLLKPEDIVEKYGIPPHNFCLARALIGDPSDNLYGIKGAGFKVVSKRIPEITLEDSLTVNDILKICNDREKTSRVKFYANVGKSEEIVVRNWKLMNLDINNLSASQIQKLLGIVDSFSPVRNKMGLMRALIKEGIAIFDADSFFMTLNTLER